MSNIKTLVFSLLISFSFLTPVYSFAKDGSTNVRDERIAARASCDAELDEIKKARNCAIGEMGGSVNRALRTKLKCEKVKGSQTDEPEYQFNEEYNKHWTKFETALEDDDNLDFRAAYYECLSGDKDKKAEEERRQEEKDEKKYTEFKKECKDANDDFNETYKEYKLKCSKAGIGDCNNNIGACLEAITSFKNDDEFAFNIFDNARSSAGTDESACPSLTAEGFKEMKEEYKRMNEMGADEQNSLAETEEKIAEIQKLSSEKIQGMELELRAAVQGLSQFIQQIDVRYEGVKSKARETEVEAIQNVENVTNDLVALREGMTEQRIQLDTDHQRMVGECIEEAKANTIARYQQLYADRSRRTAGAGNQGGVGRSAAISGGAFLGGSSQNARTRLQAEYQRQAKICTDKGSFSAETSAYYARVQNLEQNYQVKVQLLEARQAQLLRVLALRQRELQNQNEGAALELMQQKQNMENAVVSLQQNLLAEQQNTSQQLDLLNNQLNDRRRAAAYKGFQLQMFEQQYLATQKIAQQAGGEIEPGAVYEAIQAFYDTTGAAEQMLATCQCTNCYEDEFVYKTDDQAWGAKCNKTGLSFLKNMSFDTEKEICPAGDFEANENIGQDRIPASGSGSGDR